MENITITEIKGEDIWFDQDIDTDTVIASGGGVAVNGDMKDSAVKTGPQLIMKWPLTRQPSGE